MKSYTLPELQTFVREEAPRLLGGQLQDVLVNDGGLALGFWRQGTWWLVLDLSPNEPLAFVFEGTPPFTKAKPKPVSLFLNSHGRDKILRGVELLSEYGRVLRLDLSNQDGACEIEIRLIPKQVNVIVRAGGKQIAWEKPKDLEPMPAPEGLPPERDLTTMREEWLKRRRGPEKTNRDPEEQWRKKRDRDLEKKRKALTEIEKQLATSDADGWYRRGEELKAGQGEPIDPSRPLAWNIEQAFAKAKQLAAKKEGTRTRAEILRREIEALEREEFRPSAAKVAPSFDLMRKAEAKGRRMTLESGVVVTMGKSAADNLALLRKARAWDYWLHLRDYPGAHAILSRQREQKIADVDLHKAARWLAKEALGAKLVAGGGRLAVVLAECRHVRPIKGDKLGRVTYHDERHFLVDLSREESAVGPSGKD